LGAKNECRRLKVSVDLISVPGALEIPQAIRIAYEKADYDGFVALGCIIRGETTHYDTVCFDSSNGLMLLGLRGANIGNGILTVENIDQAEERSNHKGMDKGGCAAHAALTLIHHERRFKSNGQRT
jgi:6,7-dimethyl-8-ribityllumazine synthase